MMITSESLQVVVDKVLENTEFFPVEISVKPGNKICVFVDKIEGISIDECADISRAIETHMNRDVEDFELEVSSPGLTQPFKVKQQYFKNIGKEIEVLLNTGIKKVGKLVSMTNNDIVMLTSKKMKKQGSKKPEIVTENETIEFINIKSTKVYINF